MNKSINKLVPLNMCNNSGLTKKCRVFFIPALVLTTLIGCAPPAVGPMFEAGKFNEAANELENYGNRSKDSNRDDAARYYHDAGITYILIKDYKRATELLEKADTFNSTMEYPPGIAKMIALSYFSPKKALEYLEFLKREKLASGAHYIAIMGYAKAEGIGEELFNTLHNELYWKYAQNTGKNIIQACLHSVSYEGGFYFGRELCSFRFKDTKSLSGTDIALTLAVQYAKEGRTDKAIQIVKNQIQVEEKADYGKYGQRNNNGIPSVDLLEWLEAIDKRTGNLEDADFQRKLIILYKGAEKIFSDALSNTGSRKRAFERVSDFYKSKKELKRSITFLDFAEGEANQEIKDKQHDAEMDKIRNGL